MINKGIVIICNRVNNRKNMCLNSKNLEFSSDMMFNALYEAANQLSDSVTCYYSLIDFSNKIENHKSDIVISTVWSGIDSRNRRILLPALCETHALNYIGSDAYVQAICADKVLTKKYCMDYGFRSPKSVSLQSIQMIPFIKTLKLPIVIKPNFEGGSIGISDDNLVTSYEAAYHLAEELLSLYPYIIAEEYIPGNEISICIVGNKNTIQLYEVVQLELDNEKYFQNKILGYESKKGGRHVQSRTIITDKLSMNFHTKAKKLFHSLGKVDYIRIDGRLHNDDFYLIELTPDCSLHPKCYMYSAFEFNGYSYVEMVECLLNLAA